MGASIALGLLGVLTPKQVFSGLSNSTVVLFAGMFVIGAAMFQTGLAQRIGITVVHAAGTGEKRLMAAIMIVTIILSSCRSAPSRALPSRRSSWPWPSRPMSAAPSR